MRRATLFALSAALLILPRLAIAQAGEDILRKAGTFAPVPDPSFPGDKSVEYKVVWDVTDGPAKPSELTPGLARPAGFLMQTDANGINRKRVHLALIVHGAATTAMLTNEQYKAATGVDNPNIALMQAIVEAQDHARPVAAVREGGHIGDVGPRHAACAGLRHVHAVDFAVRYKQPKSRS